MSTANLWGSRRPLRHRECRPPATYRSGRRGSSRLLQRPSQNVRLAAGDPSRQCPHILGNL